MTTVLSGTNTTTMSTGLTLYQLGLVSNYGQKERTATSVTLTNKTADLSAPELITITSKDIPVVNTAIKPGYPAPVSAGVQYSVKFETCAVTTNSEGEDAFRLEEPIVVQISIRHPKSLNVDGALMRTALGRATSALFTNAGKSRLADLMRGAETPVSD